MNKSTLKYSLAENGDVYLETYHKNDQGTRRVSFTVLRKDDLQELGWTIPGTPGQLEQAAIAIGTQKNRVRDCYVRIEELEEVNRIQEERIQTILEQNQALQLYLNTRSVRGEVESADTVELRRRWEEIKKLKRTVDLQGITIGNQCNTIRKRDDTINFQRDKLTRQQTQINENDVSIEELESLRAEVQELREAFNNELELTSELTADLQNQKAFSKAQEYERVNLLKIIENRDAYILQLKTRGVDRALSERIDHQDAIIINLRHENMGLEYQIKNLSIAPIIYTPGMVSLNKVPPKPGEVTYIPPKSAPMNSESPVCPRFPSDPGYHHYGDPVKR